MSTDTLGAGDQGIMHGYATDEFKNFMPVPIVLASKIDRSGAYMARYIAKNLVASKICKRVDVQLAYAIGVAEPVGIYVDTFGTGKIPDSNIANSVQKQLKLTPSAIIEKLGLLEPIYEPLAVYGQVGRSDIELPWEKIEYLYFGV